MSPGQLSNHGLEHAERSMSGRGFERKKTVRALKGRNNMREFKVENQKVEVKV
jgi:hypothetical protein